MLRQRMLLLEREKIWIFQQFHFTRTQKKDVCSAVSMFPSSILPLCSWEAAQCRHMKTTIMRSHSHAYCSELPRIPHILVLLLYKQELLSLEDSWLLESTMQTQDTPLTSRMLLSDVCDKYTRVSGTFPYKHRSWAGN